MHLGLPSGFLPSGVSTKTLYVFLFSISQGKVMNLNHNGLFSILVPAFGTFISDFQNCAFRNKHGAVDNSKVSVGNISCQLLRLDTDSRSPAGSIEFCLRTMAFLSLRRGYFTYILLFWVSRWTDLPSGLTATCLSVCVPCRSTSNAPPLSASSPQMFRSIARSSSVACLSASRPIWRSPSCRNALSALTRPLPSPYTGCW